MLILGLVKLQTIRPSFVEEELWKKFCFESFCFVKQTDLVSTLLPSVQIYLIIHLPKLVLPILFFSCVLLNFFLRKESQYSSLPDFETTLKDTFAEFFLIFWKKYFRRHFSGLLLSVEFKAYLKKFIPFLLDIKC